MALAPEHAQPDSAGYGWAPWRMKEKRRNRLWFGWALIDAWGRRVLHVCEDPGVGDAGTY